MLINQHLVPVGMPTGTNTIVVLSALDVVFRIFIHYLSNAKIRIFSVYKKFFFNKMKKEKKNPLVYEKKKTANMSTACFEMLCNVTKIKMNLI